MIPQDSGVSGDTCELMKGIMMIVPLMRDYKKEETNRWGWLKDTQGITRKGQSNHSGTGVEGGKRGKTQRVMQHRVGRTIGRRGCVDRKKVLWKRVQLGLLS